MQVRPNPSSGKPATHCKLRTAIAATLVCAAGLITGHAATDGFQAYTLESARRINALRSPVPVPQLALELADGQRVRLAEIPARVLLIDFVYTNCSTYCAALGSVFAQLQQRLQAEIAADDIRLLSISFDPERDGPDALHAYRTRNTSNPVGWDVGRPAIFGELQTWLGAFGVVVIPDEFGGFAHNAALHVVGPDRRLVSIHDITDVDGAVKAARRILGTGVLYAQAR